MTTVLSVPALKIYRDDFLCPGTHLTMTPQPIAGRGQLRFDKDGIVLARYVNHARD
ncbi:MAG: hypothetical protein H0U76_02820 [Ktedonobacteraceae bacterium]|nr:hypothetical protein [Ktedonobacteraceae bacterium]